MTELDLSRNNIKRVAVDHFDAEGYHGATIRNIAREAGCSLPMINYYFKSKKHLFHEIIKTDYFELLSRLGQIEAIDILDFYTEFVYKLNHLGEYDKKIYRLGIKVYLGFDGDAELMEVMDAWEKSILPRHYQLIMPHLKDKHNGTVLVRTLIHLLENLIQNIVVKSRYMSDVEIREELSLILGKHCRDFQNGGGS